MTNKRKSKQAGRPNKLSTIALLLMAAFSFRLGVARLLPNDAPDDGRVYDQIARNVLERHVYSHESEAPYAPSLIRMPGYPLALAAVYSVSGPYGKTAARIVQALVDTATCGLIALVAFFWEPDEKRKRRTAIAALTLAAFCPFTTIYVATILSETPTMFLAVAMCLTATLALTATPQRKILWWWVATGLLAGTAVLFRPDSGLFALAIGLTLVVAMLSRASDVKLARKSDALLYRTARTAYLGAVFSLAFCLMLVPWAIRNYRVFHFFQPLSPAHAEMPGEFVPRGYLTWVRTWIDDDRYIPPAIWSLDAIPIKLTSLPDRAFDSADEKQRVGALLEKYNHPTEEPGLFVEPNSQTAPKPATPAEANQESESASPDQSPAGDEGGEAKPATDAGAAEKADQDDKTDGDDESAEGDDEGEGDEDASADETQAQPVEMTPEIDAAFAQIALARIKRNPFRYYVVLPLKRARSLWFDTHSDYYAFQGELLPLADLDFDIHQQYWLPLFAGALITLLACGRFGFVWRTPFISRQMAPVGCAAIFRGWLLLNDGESRAALPG